jgi:predicted PurR-regulated permease PerM
MKRVSWEWWIAGLILIGFLWRFSQLSLYFLAAVAVSFVGKPIVSWVAGLHVGKWRLGFGVGAAVALFSMASAAAGVIMLFAPLLQEQLAALGNLDAGQLTRRWNDALAAIDLWTVGVDLSGQGMSNSAYLANYVSNLFALDDAGFLFSGLISSVGNLFVATFSILFMSFFLMREPALFKDLVLALTPESKQPAMNRIMESSGHLLTRYFGGLVIQVSIVTFLVGLGLTLIGIPHGWLLGLLAGLFNLIPYIGPILGAGIGALVMISSGVDWTSFAWGMGVYLAAQGVDNVFTQPVIFAKRVFAHPLEIFVVISVAGSLAGPAGMVLAIPGYTLFRIVAKEFLQEFPWVKALTKSMEARARSTK